MISGPVDLGAIGEDNSIRITKEQLLKNSSDVDGDALSIIDLKVSKGDGRLRASTDGSWTFTPAKDWNGDIQFSYSVSDGQVNPNGQVNDNTFVRGNSLYTLVDGPTWEDAG